MEFLIRVVDTNWYIYFKHDFTVVVVNGQYIMYMYKNFQVSIDQFILVSKVHVTVLPWLNATRILEPPHPAFWPNLWSPNV